MAPESVTLNGVMAVILRYSTESGSFGDQLSVKVCGNRPIVPLSATRYVVQRIKFLAIYDL